MLRNPSAARERTWQELDALVLEEVEALIDWQQRGVRARTKRERAEPRREQPLAAPFSEPLDEAEALAEARDEEAFIDRSVEFLRGRPDAGALLEAVRAAIAEAEGEAYVDGADRVEAVNEAGALDERADDLAGPGDEAQPEGGPKA
jgi:hypothetical protein